MSVLDHYVQGSFTSDGTAHSVNLPCDVDFFEVDNWTKIATNVNGSGVKFRWQRGMAADTGIQEATDAAGVLTISDLTSGGFTLLNTADPQTPGPALTGTTYTAATKIFTTAGTGTLVDGDIVEVYNVTGALQLSGYQFTVDQVTANTSFRIPYGPAGAVNGTAVTYRVIKNQPMYYPRRLFITAITQATSAVVTFSVTHNLTVGQRIVFGVVPAMYGMTQISGLRGLITAINTTNNTVTVDIDSSAFTAFAFPLTATAATPHTLPSAVPFGDGPNPASNPLGNQDVLDGATRNTAIRGMYLAAGANSPAGINGDLIYWRAWKAEQLQTS
jgi:hypothetical protein